VLTLGTVPVREDPSPRPTSFSVVNLDDPARWEARDERGEPVTSAAVGNRLEIATTVARRRFVVRRAPPAR
jgi:hypothetical protein